MIDNPIPALPEHVGDTTLWQGQLYEYRFRCTGPGQWDVERPESPDFSGKLMRGRHVDGEQLFDFLYTDAHGSGGGTDRLGRIYASFLH